MGTPVLDLEENIDSVQLRCHADANPPATVIWRRLGPAHPSLVSSAAAAAHHVLATSSGASDIYSFQEVLEFSPVTRKDSATYSCEAKNPIGSSNMITVPIDIKCKSTTPILFYGWTSSIFTFVLHQFRR